MGPEIGILVRGFDAVYVEIPKVACTSMKVALARLLDIRLDHLDGNPHEADFPVPPEPSAHDRRLYPGLYAFAFTSPSIDIVLEVVRFDRQDRTG